jgi:hypothetical protein
MGVKQSYIKYLRALENSLEPRNLNLINELMQEKYPGNYKAIEYYSSKRGCFELKLQFDNEKEETLFILKYS